MPKPLAGKLMTCRACPVSTQCRRTIFKEFVLTNQNSQLTFFFFLNQGQNYHWHQPTQEFSDSSRLYDVSVYICSCSMLTMTGLSTGSGNNAATWTTSSPWACNFWGVKSVSEKVQIGVLYFFPPAYFIGCLVQSKQWNNFSEHVDFLWCGGINKDLASLISLFAFMPGCCRM